MIILLRLTMLRFKHYHYDQHIMLVINLEEQLQPGTFASKEWSGTFKELQNKRDKIKRQITYHLEEHQRQDRLDDDHQ